MQDVWNQCTRSVGKGDEVEDQEKRRLRRRVGWKLDWSAQQEEWNMFGRKEILRLFVSLFLCTFIFLHIASLKKILIFFLFSHFLFFPYPSIHIEWYERILLFILLYSSCKFWRMMSESE
jgi:hypothetical protein